MQWPEAERPRRAGVSSFGVSGTNAHVVLEQAPVPGPVAAQPEPVVSTLVISGKTPERIAPIAAMLADWMDGDGAAVPLADVAHTLNNHRARYKSFAAVSARDRTQAVAGLRHGAPGDVPLSSRNALGLGQRDQGRDRLGDADEGVERSGYVRHFAGLRRGGRRRNAVQQLDEWGAGPGGAGDAVCDPAGGQRTGVCGDAARDLCIRAVEVEASDRT